MASIISTNTLAIRRTGSLPPAKPGTAFINMVVATITAVGQAFTMAYVQPYQRRPLAEKDVDLQGRDPNW